MTTPLQTEEMDIGKKTLIFVHLVFYMICVSGGEVPQPKNLVVDIMEGEVVVHWDKPVGAPSDIQYNVQMINYSHTGQWTAVHSCTGITYQYCDISSFIYDYRHVYRVRVQLVAGDAESAWVRKTVTPNDGKLLPPSFTLWATSSTIAVKVHQKPILKKLFPYGVTYTIYLEDRDNKTTTAYLNAEAEEDQKTKTFSSLHWGRVYCVSIKVEGKGAVDESKVSPQQCLELPEQEWFIIAVVSLSTLGGLALVAIVVMILLCYLKRPEKTPVALKSPKSSWLPLSIGEGTMEVVTDKGWFLSGYRTEVKKCIKDPVTHVIITEDNEEEDRRTSMDSGVSMEANSTTNSGGSPPTRQEDSGCGSMGGPESSTSSQTDYPLQEERTELDVVRKREDSGLGMGCQLHSSSMNLDGRDSESLKEIVAGGDYRRQSPSSVQIHACGDEEAFKQIHPDSVLADVVTGYRAGPQSCICSGAGQCTWCHKQDVYGTGHIKEYRPTCIDNGLLSGKCDFVDSYKRGFTFSSYCKKTQMDTVTVDDIETTFIQLGENFPLLTALTPRCLIEEGKDFNMNNVTLSLCDVQLTSE
ncbi:Interleukin-10 receptor subunit alpha [Collichthys lucidus]|uniref:Interleukin-10 receptor subunit alpha n=1 Tax=Collichthys lucidus TaxID=240159 RepID=A0A4U5V0G9_COLLU|nr:Interleukin-10 receptor subunit alpha [Collichthys lucidus]